MGLLCLPYNFVAVWCMYKYGVLFIKPQGLQEMYTSFIKMVTLEVVD